MTEEEERAHAHLVVLEIDSAISHGDREAIIMRERLSAMMAQSEYEGAELAACKAKLARVEALATNMEQNWISDPDLDDVVRAVRATLADSGDKP